MLVEMFVCMSGTVWDVAVGNGRLSGGYAAAVSTTRNYYNFIGFKISAITLVTISTCGVLALEHRNIKLILVFVSIASLVIKT
jgi:hypothetical protein